MTPTCGYSQTSPTSLCGAQKYGGSVSSTSSSLLRRPAETPFADALFDIVFTVPESYPLAPPHARFVTKIFHPNIHFKVTAKALIFSRAQTGDVCLDILKTNWTPAWTLQSICRAIITLLAHPEPDSPLNCDAGNLLRTKDYRAYSSIARMYVAMFAGRA
jgi:peroxin-4